VVDNRIARSGSGATSPRSAARQPRLTGAGDQPRQYATQHRDKIASSLRCNAAWASLSRVVAVPGIMVRAAGPMPADPATGDTAMAGVAASAWVCRGAPRPALPLTIWRESAGGGDAHLDSEAELA
jgi:hypothetical protein